jgi:hypothetical protein
MFWKRVVLRWVTWFCWISDETKINKLDNPLCSTHPLSVYKAHVKRNLSTKVWSVFLYLFVCADVTQHWEETGRIWHDIFFLFLFCCADVTGRKRPSHHLFTLISSLSPPVLVWTHDEKGWHVFFDATTRSTPIIVLTTWLTFSPPDHLHSVVACTPGAMPPTRRSNHK